MNLSSLTLLRWGIFDSRVKYPRDITTADRPVTHYELEFFLQDQSGASFLDGKHIPLRRGTFICAKPGHVRHSRLPVRCLYMHLECSDPDTAALLNRIPDTCLLPDPSALEACFQKLLTPITDHFPEEQLLLQSAVLELLYHLLRQSTAPGPVPAVTAHHRAMVRAEAFIRENLHSPLALKDIADTVNLSASYFHKLFCRHFGMTPNQFLLNCRISAAKALLVSGELSMSAIAEQCGFSSQAYFNCRFHQLTGTTPSRYRREHLSRLEP